MHQKRGTILGIKAHSVIAISIIVIIGIIAYSFIVYGGWCDCEGCELMIIDKIFVCKRPTSPPPPGPPTCAELDRCNHACYLYGSIKMPDNAEWFDATTTNWECEDTDVDPYFRCIPPTQVHCNQKQCSGRDIEGQACAIEGAPPNKEAICKYKTQQRCSDNCQGNIVFNGICTDSTSLGCGQEEGDDCNQPGCASETTFSNNRVCGVEHESNGNLAWDTATCRSVDPSQDQDCTLAPENSCGTGIEDGENVVYTLKGVCNPDIPGCDVEETVCDGVCYRGECKCQDKPLIFSLEGEQVCCEEGPSTGNPCKLKACEYVESGNSVDVYQDPGTVVESCCAGLCNSEEPCVCEEDTEA